jgi:hypothetical protein
VWSFRPFLRPIRRLTIALAVSLAPALSVAAEPAALGRADEYRVKAAILYSLAKFVNWPPEVFPEPATPLVICVLGTDPFGPVLDDVVRGHVVARRAVLVRRVVDVTPGCHLLFLGESDPKRLAQVVDRLRNSSVLTVSEAEAFTEHGGMIGLGIADERVRFDVNADAIESARLRVSSQVLALATSVKRSGPER